MTREGIEYRSRRREEHSEHLEKERISEAEEPQETEGESHEAPETEETSTKEVAGESEEVWIQRRMREIAEEIRQRHWEEGNTPSEETEEEVESRERGDQGATIEEAQVCDAGDGLVYELRVREDAVTEGESEVESEETKRDETSEEAATREGVVEGGRTEHGEGEQAHGQELDEAPSGCRGFEPETQRESVGTSEDTPPEVAESRKRAVGEEATSTHEHRESELGHPEHVQEGEGAETDLRDDFRRRVREVLEAREDDDGYTTDALSGRRIYRGSEFFQESEEEEERRRLRELFSELTEEEREYFKEWVRSQVRTEEELDELLEQYAERVRRHSPEEIDAARAHVRGEVGEVPDLLKELRALETERQWASLVDERAREDFENRVEERTGLQRLEGSWIRQALSESAPEGWDHERLAEALAEVGRHLPESSRIVYVDVREVPPLTEALERVRERLEREGVRVGLVEERLYLWRPDTTPTRLESLYSGLYYYFRNEDGFNDYIKRVSEGLGFDDADRERTLKHVKDMANQMIARPQVRPCINTKLIRVRGDFVWLMNEIAARPLSELNGEVSKLTKPSGKGGIQNPRFPEGEALEIALARLTAVVISDCNLKKNGTLTYGESDIGRIRIVERNLQVFGDIRLKARKRKKENLYISHLPTPLGIIMLNLGIPHGDRTIQNPGLFPSIMRFAMWARAALIEDLIPQDGSISGETIRWTHSNALDAGNKAVAYGVQGYLSDREVSLIKKYGNREEHGWVLNYGKLRDLCRSDEVEIRNVAKSLWDIVHANTNRLIEDEIEIVKSLGITYLARPYTVRYLERTGRVSVAWTAEPKGIIESIKLGALAPPNDLVKKQIVKDILRRKRKHVEEVKKWFENQGIAVREWWEEEV